MGIIIKLKNDLAIYQHCIMLYKNNDGVLYLGHCFNYNGRDDAAYLLFLYKDALPNQFFLDGWNTLDENSISTIIVNERSMDLGIQDFLAVYAPSLNFASLAYEEVEDFAEINRISSMIKNGETKAYIIKKK